MEPNECRALNWKTCFKKILAPHLLNPSNGEEQNDGFDASHKILNPENNNLNYFTISNDLERSKSLHKDTISITKESIQTNENSKPFTNAHHQDFDFSDSKLNDFENTVETEENIASVISDHAEKLSESFKSLKITKNKHFNKSESTRRAPNWNIAFKKVLGPKSVPESSLKTLTSEHSEMLDSSVINPWTFHRLIREDTQQPECMEEVLQQSCSENSKNKKHYTEAEKKVLDILRLSRCFKQKKKPHINIFDGAGVNCFKNEVKSFRENSTSNIDKQKYFPPPSGRVNCFKDNEVKSYRENTTSSIDKPKYFPPSGRVTVRNFTVEDALNSPQNINTSEFWDPEDDYSTSELWDPKDEYITTELWDPI